MLALRRGSGHKAPPITSCERQYLFSLMDCCWAYHHISRQALHHIKWGARLHVVGHIIICFCIFILLLLFISLFLLFVLNFFFVFVFVLFYDREKRKIMKLGVSVGLFCNEILSYMAARHYSLCFIKFP